MVTAFVLINVQGKDVQSFAEHLLDLAGVTEVHVVAGEYDMVAVVRVADNAALSRLITKQIVPAPGVARTKTLFSLETHSRFDLAKLFAVP